MKVSKGEALGLYDFLTTINKICYDEKFFKLPKEYQDRLRSKYLDMVTNSIISFFDKLQKEHKKEK